MSRRAIFSMLAVLSLAGAAWGQPDVAAISGRVVDADGEPVGDVVVQITPTDYRGRIATAQSAADGSFSMARVAPGPYRMRLTTGGVRLRGIEAAAATADGTLDWELAEPIDTEIPPLMLEAGQRVRVDLHVGSPDDPPFEPTLPRLTSLIQQGRCADAVGPLRAHLEGFPFRARGYYLLGYCLGSTGDADGAAGAIGTALELQPGMPGAALLMGQVLLASGRRADAVEWLRREAQEGGDSRLKLEAWNALAFAARDAGMMDEAIAAFEQLRAADPDRVAAYEELGRLYVQAGRLDDAERVLADCPSPGSIAADTLLNIGITRYNDKQYDAAAITLNLALTAAQTDRQRAMAHALLGRCHFHGGREGEARAELRRSLELDPQGEFADESRNLLADLDG